MKLTIIILGIFACGALVGGTLLWARYADTQSELARVSAELTRYTTNEKILTFGKMFSEKVLKAGEVSFDDRVKLENAALEIGNAEVLGAWKRFVESKTEIEAQANVKDLIHFLFVHIAEKK